MRLRCSRPATTPPAGPDRSPATRPARQPHTGCARTVGRSARDRRHRSRARPPRAAPLHRLPHGRPRRRLAGGRVVLSARSTGSGVPAVGIPREWTSLSQASAVGASWTQKTAHRTLPLRRRNAKDRLAYLRGDRAKEQGGNPGGRCGAAPPAWRDRNSRLRHQPAPAAAYSAEDHAGFRRALAARPPMLYVGAGDGMLHGFDASTGEERIAYVPEGLHAGWPDSPIRLAAGAFGRRLAPGRRPVPGRAGHAIPAGWRSYLAGFLGAGGRGYFVLDVTDPAAFDRASAERAVVLIAARPSMDDDIGEIMGEPATEAGDPSISRQITPMNDGRWALVIGNGERSASGTAVLPGPVPRPQARTARHHCRPRPRQRPGAALIDLDGNGTADVALRGRPARQPVEVRPPRGKRRKLEDRVRRRSAVRGARRVRGSHAPADHRSAGLEGPSAGRSDRTRHRAVETRPPTGHLQGQTIYGVHDDTPILRQGTAGQAEDRHRASAPARGRRQRSHEAWSPRACSWTAPTAPAPCHRSRCRTPASEARRGWFLDLPLQGERVLQNPGWFEGDLIDLRSQLPAPGSRLDLPPTPARRAFLPRSTSSTARRPGRQLYAHLPGRHRRPAFAAGSRPRHRHPGRPAREIDLRARPAPVAPPMQRLGSILLRPGWRQLQ